MRAAVLPAGRVSEVTRTGERHGAQAGRGDQLEHARQSADGRLPAARRAVVVGVVQQQRRRPRGCRRRPAAPPRPPSRGASSRGPSATTAPASSRARAPRAAPATSRCRTARGAGPARRRAPARARRAPASKSRATARAAPTRSRLRWRIAVEARPHDRRRRSRDASAGLRRDLLGRRGRTSRARRRRRARRARPGVPCGCGPSSNVIATAPGTAHPRRDTQRAGQRGDDRRERRQRPAAAAMPTGAPVTSPPPHERGTARGRRGAGGRRGRVLATARWRSRRWRRGPRPRRRGARSCCGWSGERVGWRRQSWRSRRGPARPRALRPSGGWPLHVAALALAPLAVVQPTLALGLVHEAWSDAGVAIGAGLAGVAAGSTCRP